MPAVLERDGVPAGLLKPDLSYWRGTWALRADPNCLLTSGARKYQKKCKILEIMSRRVAFYVLRGRQITHSQPPAVLARNLSGMAERCAFRRLRSLVRRQDISLDIPRPRVWNVVGDSKGARKAHGLIQVGLSLVEVQSCSRLGPRCLFRMRLVSPVAT